MSVTVCAICLEPLTTGGALTPVHAACLGVDADLLALARAVVAFDAARILVDERRLYLDLLKKARPILERAARAEHTTITDEPTGTDAPTQGDDHAE
jgi:hypothetical protein